MSHPLIVPMVAHVALAAFLYALLTVVRAPATWGVGRARDGSNPFAQIERRISANVRLRGLVFTINFLAVLGLWALIVSRSMDD